MEVVETLVKVTDGAIAAVVALLTNTETSSTAQVASKQGMYTTAYTH
jgi:hypothetical protein